MFPRHAAQPGAGPPPLVLLQVQSRLSWPLHRVTLCPLLVSVKLEPLFLAPEQSRTQTHTTLVTQWGSGTPASPRGAFIDISSTFWALTETRSQRLTSSGRSADKGKAASSPNLPRPTQALLGVTPGWGSQLSSHLPPLMPGEGCHPRTSLPRAWPACSSCKSGEWTQVASTQGTA